MPIVKSGHSPFPGNSVYAGGAFTKVGTQSRNYLAAMDAGGTVLAWDPGASNYVSALATAGSTLYAGGYFTSVKGVTRNHLAAINSDGTLGDWNPSADGAVVSLAISGSTIFASGGFATVAGTARRSAAAIGPDGSALSWNPIPMVSSLPWPYRETRCMQAETSCVCGARGATTSPPSTPMARGPVESRCRRLGERAGRLGRHGVRRRKIQDRGRRAPNAHVAIKTDGKPTT